MTAVPWGVALFPGPSSCSGGFPAGSLLCCLVGAIVWPFWWLRGPSSPFLAIWVPFGVILAPRWPFLISSASFWLSLSISAGFWPLHGIKRHKIDAYTLTMHLLWDPGHTQASRRIFIPIGFGAACCLLATIWRPTWRVITINKPISTSSVTLIKTAY